MDLRSYFELKILHLAPSYLLENKDSPSGMQWDPWILRISVLAIVTFWHTMSQSLNCASGTHLFTWLWKPVQVCWGLFSHLQNVYSNACFVELMERFEIMHVSHQASWLAHRSCSVNDSCIIHYWWWLYYTGSLWGYNDSCTQTTCQDIQWLSICLRLLHEKLSKSGTHATTSPPCTLCRCFQSVTVSPNIAF